MILASQPELAMWLAVLTAIAYAIPAFLAQRMGSSLTRRALWLAWVLHGFTLVTGLWGETPRFGFAPALSVTIWWVLTAYAVESQYFPQLKARWAMAALGSAAVALALGEAFCLPFSFDGAADADPSSLLSLLLLLLFFLDFLPALPFDSLAGAAIPECE